MNLIQPPKFTGWKPLQFRSELKWGGLRRKGRQRTEKENQIKEDFLAWIRSRFKRGNELIPKEWKQYGKSNTLTFDKNKLFDLKYDICQT